MNIQTSLKRKASYRNLQTNRKGKAAYKTSLKDNERETLGRPNDLEYKPLDKDRSEIRLLILKPGQWNEKVCCDLETVSLDDNPEYETISYVWGDVKVRKPINVDGSRIEVTVNLFSALRRFRYPDTPRVLWADAVCINQGDKNERSGQVQLMGRIYKECWEVLIWLGEEGDFPFDPPPFENHLPYRVHEVARFEEYIREQNIRHIAPFETTLSSSIIPRISLDIPAALHLLQLLAEGKHLYEFPFFRIETFPKFAICRRWYNVCSSLIHFLSRPWFKRLWTVQEAVLPSKATLQLGRSQIDLEILLKANKNFNQHLALSDCCTSICGMLWDDGRDSKDGLHEAFRYALLTELDAAKLFHHQRRAADLGEEMATARERALTDPHDCIYGLLGVFPDIIPKAEIPDYDIGIATLFSRCTKRLFESTLTLDYFRDIRHQSSNPYNLPSWCLNWNQPELLMDQHSNACGEFQQYHAIPSLQSDKILAVEATFLGEISTVPDAASTLEKIGNLRNAITSWQKLASEAASIVGDEFWKVVFLDRPIVNENQKIKSRDMLKMDTDDFLTVERWWKYLLTLDPTKCDYQYIPYPVEEFQECFSKFSLIHDMKTKTAFYSTNTGLVGVTNSKIQRDDRICVCKGSPFPLILRPCDGGLYSFVGVSYVHGIMDGSATVGAKWETVFLC